ncbi:MAG: hypothetical protein AAGC64_12955 [Bacteroidota bacterium]
MKKIVRSFSLLFIFLLYVSIAGFAQDKPIEVLVNDFVKEINKNNQDQSFAGLEKLMVESVKVQRTVINLNGTYKTVNQDRSMFLDGFRQLSSNPEISGNSQVETIYEATQKKNTGFVAAKINVKLMTKNNIAEKLSIYFSAVGVKVSNTWKFVEIKTTEVLEERNAGRCFCDFYEKDQDYAVEVRYPDGLMYKKDVLTIKYLRKDDERTIILDDAQYTWEKDGNVVNKNDPATALGSAKIAKDAAVLILKKKYDNSCIGLVSR